ncbi:MAG: SurA N-terminal domain-containing protein, partial [Actinobacteria bacterium]|nr:SurA N-terminal domain-containing protein [Actinomycetota bacterium]
MRNKLIIFVVVIVAVVVGVIYLFQNVFIAANVNGQAISRLQVIKELEKQGGKNVLDSIVTETIIQQEAKKKNITVSQKEIDNELSKIEANVKQQGSTLDQALQSQNMTKNDLLDRIKIQLMLQKLVGSSNVTDKEIDNYIATNKQEPPKGVDEKTFRAQIKTQLMQQKTQQSVQEYITKLKNAAKI